MSNPIKNLWKYKQSPWYDNLSRQLIASGELQRMMRDDGLRGITSNPTIFDKAISSGTDYDDSIQDLVEQGERDSQKIFEHLAVADIRRAADLLFPLYKLTGGADGFVSLEVAPSLAHDTQGTIRDAKRLWSMVGRSNLMIKVPATLEGIPAVEALIGEGINVNVTLIFSNRRYELVANAYISGLERLAKTGKDLSLASSVASFFVSRIDSAVDKQLTNRLVKMKNSSGAAPYKLLMGKTAIANAKTAYQRFREIFSSPRFSALQSKGARAQRVLWASTGTKNPEYRDVLYVEELIGPDTVNTIPPATWQAFRAHGKVQPRLEVEIQDAKDVLSQLKEVGIDLDAITDQLEAEGVKSFVDSYDSLLHSISGKVETISTQGLGPKASALDLFKAPIRQAIESLAKEGIIGRIYAHDASVWKKDTADEAVIQDSLGWLNLPEFMAPKVGELSGFAQEIQKAGFTQVLLLGMGGSSLAPEVFRRVFEGKDGFPKLRVLDSTDPDAVAAADRQAPPETTLYVVSSKSGTTTEPLRLFDYFYARAAMVHGDKAGAHFVAITDPGSYLEKQAVEKKFRRVFLNPSDIGGRYSALSYFGLVPAALMGVDVATVLDRARRMMQSCSSPEGKTNPGLWLGSVLGVLAQQGRDKITFLVSPELSGLDLWLEQLLAESTGKQGKGVVPVSGEPLGDPAKYGEDRVFVHIDIESSKSYALDVFTPDLERAGHPVIRLRIKDRLELGAEFYRWEAATAVMGHVLKINPFDQPDVQSAKDRTNAILKQLSEQGSVPSIEIQASLGDLKSATFSFSKAAIKAFGTSEKWSAEIYLERFLSQVAFGDYLGVLAYVVPDGKYETLLRGLQGDIFQAVGAPVQLGYGPRYLHSTGQLHKGGPNNGVFLILVPQDIPDVKIPGAPYSFGQLISSQAIGDFQALNGAGRRALLVRAQGPFDGTIERLSKMILAHVAAPVRVPKTASGQLSSGVVSKGAERRN